MAKPKNLDELKDALYTAFGTAVERSVYPYASSGADTSRALTAAADIARSIVLIEQELTSRNEKKDGPKLPGK